MAEILPPLLNPVWNTPPWAHDFWANVTREEFTTCWLWRGVTSAREYGQFNGSTWGTSVAHRISYMWVHGPIPYGKVIDHLCRVPRCVRPEHLQPVTNAENILRGIGQPALNARASKCVNGHPLSGDNLIPSRLASVGERQCRACANERSRIRHYESPSESADSASCPGCGRLRHVRDNGTMHKHRLPDGEVCVGSGQLPAKDLLNAEATDGA